MYAGLLVGTSTAVWGCLVRAGAVVSGGRLPRGMAGTSPPRRGEKLPVDRPRILITGGGFAGFRGPRRRHVAQAHRRLPVRAAAGRGGHGRTGTPPGLRPPGHCAAGRSGAAGGSPYDRLLLTVGSVNKRCEALRAGAARSGGAKALTCGHHLLVMPGNRVRVAPDWLLGAVLPGPAIQLGSSAARPYPWRTPHPNSPYPRPDRSRRGPLIQPRPAPISRRKP